MRKEGSWPGPLVPTMQDLKPLWAARSRPSRAHRAATLRQSALQDTGLQDCLMDGPEVHRNGMKLGDCDLRVCVRLGRGDHAAQQAIIMELSKQESRSSACNNQEAEQAGITQLSRQ